MALELSYEPAEVVDTSTLSRSKWLDYRRKGIGGSDAAAVYGVSPWKTGRDLYYEKIGKEPVREDESNWVALEYGHRLEDLVAKIFTFKTGIPAFEDRAMYAHGLFPFMLADVDFLITLPDGSTGILECKTTAMSNKEQWEDGAVPFHYELQVRHYMAVMNLDVAYIACLYGNNDASFVYQRIERDLEAEEDLIQREKEFWESYVLPKTEPPYIEDVDLVLNSLQRYMAAADQAVPEVVLDGKYSSALSEYLQLAQKKSVLAKQVEKLEQCQKALYLPLLELLGSACKGVCTSPTGEIYDVSYKPSYRTTIPKAGILKLQELHPEIYREYVQTSESRRINITKRKEDAP